MSSDGVLKSFQPCIVLIPFFNGTKEEGRAEFKPFLDLSEFTFVR